MKIPLIWESTPNIYANMSTPLWRSLVAQRTFNPLVVGSNLTGGTTILATLSGV